MSSPTRSRVRRSLEAVLIATWTELPDAIPAALTSATRIVVLDAASSAAAVEIKRHRPDVGILTFVRTPDEVRAAAIHGADEVVLDAVASSPFAIAEVVRRVGAAGIAQITVADVREVLPLRLQAISDAIILSRLHRVEDVADALGVQRQTIGLWCRKAGAPAPETLLSWCRVAHAATMLELTNDAIDDVATALDFSSPTALRNQMKRYVGVTASDVRVRGRHVVLAAFSDAMRGATRASDRRPDPALPASAEAHPARSSG